LTHPVVCEDNSEGSLNSSKMNKLSKLQSAYIAGFLDADGSIYIKLTRNNTYKYHFQVSPNIVFYQSSQSKTSLKTLQQMIQSGYLRSRNDGMEEYILGDTSSIRQLLKAVKPFLLFKQLQAELMLQILDLKKEVNSPADFLSLCTLIDNFKDLNYSKKRTVLAETVRLVLIEEGFITP